MSRSSGRVGACFRAHTRRRRRITWSIGLALSHTVGVAGPTRNLKRASRPRHAALVPWSWHWAPAWTRDPGLAARRRACRRPWRGPPARARAEPGLGLGARHGLGPGPKPDSGPSPKVGPADPGSGYSALPAATGPQSRAPATQESPCRAPPPADFPQAGRNIGGSGPADCHDGPGWPWPRSLCAAALHVSGHTALRHMAAPEHALMILSPLVLGGQAPSRSASFAIHLRCLGALNSCESIFLRELKDIGIGCRPREL